MPTLIVHLTDAGAKNAQSTIKVNQLMELGRATHEALDGMVAEGGTEFRFPVFIDIHLAEKFGDVAWMHAENASGR